MVFVIIINEAYLSRWKKLSAHSCPCSIFRLGFLRDVLSRTSRRMVVLATMSPPMAALSMESAR
jgi:hypothetical protein